MALSKQLAEELEKIKTENKISSLFSQEFAELLDRKDQLHHFRSQFHIPKQPPHHESSTDSIYLCGHSLGPMPKATEKYIEEELRKWKLVGVEGHFTGKRPWSQIDEYVTKLTAKVVGAHPDEVAVMDGLSVNLHLLLASFYQPTSTRYKILIEDSAFCSDQHVVYSQVKYRKLDSSQAVLALKPRQGEFTLRTEDILKCIEEQGESIAVIMFGGVQFYTGQFFEIEKIVKAGHKKGCIVAFDLAHAVGNVPLKLHDWGVDWAAWCSYKYLNSGPGSIAGIFVHERHHSKTFDELPRYLGWWGQNLETRFVMSGEHKWKPGAQSYMLSNPPALPCVCLEAALEIHVQANPEALREKSLRLTRYLELLLDQQIDSKDFIIVTPRDPKQRGCQLSLLLKGFPVRQIHKKLAENGVFCDVREPNCIRVAPHPVYNTFSDIYHFVSILKKVLLDAKKSKL